MRPVSMRVSKTYEGHNRVRCWAGFHKAVDYVDESGAFLEGGRFGLLVDGWARIFFDDVEVFLTTKGSLFLLR